MSRAEELERKAQERKARRAAREAAGQESAGTTPAVQARPVTSSSTNHAAAALAPVANPKATPIRSTVDLPPMRHVGLKAWAGDTAVEIGAARVTTQDVLGALVGRLLTDETLARLIKADLREIKEQERLTREAMKAHRKK